MALHTILGANGTIATELVPILQQHGEEIRLVSRFPKIVDGTHAIAADLLNREATIQAVAGSEMVYLLVGLEYNSKVWARDWPVLMQNVIEACKAANASLFFSIMYILTASQRVPLPKPRRLSPSVKKELCAQG